MHITYRDRLKLLLHNLGQLLSYKHEKALQKRAMHLLRDRCPAQTSGKLSIPPLKSIPFFNKAKCALRILSQNVPPYLRPLHRSNLKNSQCDLYKKSINYSAARLWNTLLSDLITLTSDQTTDCISQSGICMFLAELATP